MNGRSYVLRMFLFLFFPTHVHVVFLLNTCTKYASHDAVKSSVQRGPASKSLRYSVGLAINAACFVSTLLV